MADEIAAQEQAHTQHIKEKAARAEQLGLPIVWPVTPDGKPYAIVIGLASELIPTVKFGNVQLGPAGIYLPVDTSEMNDEQIIERMREVQRMAQTTLGMERQLLQWAVDPARRAEWEAGAGS